MPTELVFAVVTAILIIVTLGVAVPTAWFLARIFRRHWPAALRSATALALLALLGPGVSLSIGFMAPTLLAVLAAGAFGCAWTLLLLLITWPADPEVSPSRAALLRLFILGCLVLSGFGVFLGLAIGASQGIH